MNDDIRSTWLEKPITNFLPKFNLETLIIIVILILAVLSRFTNVGARVMSHDEVNHVVPSWDLAMGRGYSQDPVTHGPLQFHLIALSYFLFGDSDFTSRIPAALFSVAAIAVVLLTFRRYLGKWGHIIGGILFLISPFLLFYGRYTRNEGIIELIAVLMLYATLRYLDRGDKFSLTLLVVAQALNFSSKETAYIYMAQLLLFLAFVFLMEITREKWSSPQSRRIFMVTTSAAIGFLITGIGLAYMLAKQNPITETGESIASTSSALGTFSNLSVLLAIGFGIVAVFILLKELGLVKIRHLRSFDLLILNGSLILPLLAAFPINILGSLLGTNWSPTDYSSMGIVRIGITLSILIILSAAIGLWWNKKVWIYNTIVFWVIFIVFYTTFFTNGRGFFTGIVGSLGYWLVQQSVNRGSQPVYYYLLLQIPIYEYLAAMGFFLACLFGLRRFQEASIPVAVPYKVPDLDEIPADSEVVESNVPYQIEEKTEISEPQIEPASHRVPVLFLFIFWSITSLVAYSLAGEKMPWLTVHIAIPLLLTAAWGFNKLIESISWNRLKENKNWVTILLLPVFLSSLLGIVNSLNAIPLPFQGQTLEELQTTSNFLLSVMGLGLSTYGIYYFSKNWKIMDHLKLVLLAFFVFMSILTARAAYAASFMNYDDGKEFLVYAHAARGPKDILQQVEEISRRTVGDKQISVAYDNDSLYPYWWYFRDYPNKVWYTDKPTRDLLNSPIILASNENYSKVDALTKNDYIKYDYLRLLWPMQDYYNLTWERISYAISNSEMRSALFDIWLNRDYSQYAAIKDRSDLTDAAWQPNDTIRMYIRKDVVADIWNYGSVPAVISEPVIDPYEGQISMRMADKSIGSFGQAEGQFNAPRGIAIALDGTLFIADSLNHRIQHLNPDGTFINSWGGFADSSVGTAPGGQFNEPWGVAIGPDGSVFVTDTWNHRIQKFDQQGNFLLQWGYFGTAENPDGFWGPRGIAVDQDGRVFITDTGNKRVAVFDSNGGFITQFGEAGFDLGQFDEPVGITIGNNGDVFVADTWNQRIQVFSPNEDHTIYSPMNSWEIAGWFGQSLDNKPFLASDLAGNIYTTDPEGYRILVFQPDGIFIRGWGDYSPNSDGFGLPSAIAVDAENGVWVTDPGNQTILYFNN